MNEYAGREKEIEAREKAATEGPWHHSFDIIVHKGTIPWLDVNNWERDEDADFVAHAREDIPYLLAQLREARETLAAVKEYARYLHDNRDVLDSIIVARDLDRILKGGVV